MRRIQPRDYVAGEFTLPGDKSITHRAIMLNGGTEGEAVISNALLGEDCLSTCRCMRALGAEIDVDGTTLRVKGTPRFRRGRKLNCGNSATTLRLLTGLIAGKEIDATLYGDESLSTRPMQRVSDPLSLLGANVKTTDGHPPVYVSPNPLYGTEINLEIASAQVKSAILLAGISAEGETIVTQPMQSRDHTERMLSAMGADIRVRGNRVLVKKSVLKATDVLVPSDISSASYLMTLGALKGEILCKNVGTNPTRMGILKAFDLLGVEYELRNQRVSGGEPTADIWVKKSPMRGITLTADPSMIDELPLIALLCAFAEGESRIMGAGELSVKESNRIRATTELINNIGGDCQATEDGFIIRGKKKLPGGNVDSYLDHRMAMTGAIALLASENGGDLYRPECCAISFPDFFEKLGIKS